MVCTDCSNKASQGYYLQPTTFDGKTDSCPWDCNAGYYFNSDAGSCVSCRAGVSFSSSLRVTQDDPPNQCTLCQTCTDGLTYQTQACTTVADRVCTACSTPCTGRNYESTACANGVNRVCSACKTCGPNNYIFSDCSNTADTDTTVCQTCNIGSDCPSGLFLPTGNLCTGTETSRNYCQRCSPRACPSGYYLKECSGNDDSTCVPYTTCDSCFYLADRDLYADGVCTPCSTCNTSVSQPCTQYTDTLCLGEACNSYTPCR